MAEAALARRRGHGEDSIYFDATKNRYVGAVSVGWGPDGKTRIRRKVRGKTKQEVRDKLRALHREMDAGPVLAAAGGGGLAPGWTGGQVSADLPTLRGAA